MKTYRFSPLLAATLLAAGCAKNNDPGGPPENCDPVHFNATITQTPGGNQTRTTGGGNAWAQGDRVGVFMTAAGTGGGTIEANHPYTAATTGALTPDGNPMYYPQDGSAVDFTAYYPYDAAATPGTPLTLTVAGQTSADAQNALDVLWARTPGKSESSPAVALPFGHVLGKVTFDITLGDGLDALTGNDIAAVALGGMPLAASLDLLTGALTAASTTGGFAALKTTATGGAAASFTALVVPQTGGTGRTATFTVGGDVFTWTIPADEAFEAGKNYAYPVTVNRTGVSVGAATIARWYETDHGTGTPAEYTRIGRAKFTDGGECAVWGRETDDDGGPGGTCEMFFDGDGSKVVYSVAIDEFPGREYLIGRRADETVTLKLDAAGDVLFRDADGKIPIGTFAEFARINTDATTRAGDYLQEADLDMLGAASTPQNWTPTGTGGTGNRFTGSYDGGGFRLANLFIDHPDRDYTGLFGAVGPSGSLSRIGIVSGSVTGEQLVGSVCGENYGTIIDCYNDATVTGTSSVGGVCGSTSSGGITTDCHNTGTVTGTDAGVGGVCGVTSDGTITDCYNTGIVSGTDNVGGVCGNNSGGTITACYNTGAVTGTGYNVGGVCAFNDEFGVIAACYNTSSVSGNNYVGGVCGTNDIFGSGSTITACYNTGTVTGTGGNVGGVCGTNNSSATITACWFLQYGSQPGVGSDRYGLAEATPFGDGTNGNGWPSVGDGSGGWALYTPGTPPSGYWKALSPDPLGGWVAGGTPSGATSVFPRLWWE
jgi:hypothetical protein